MGTWSASALEGRIVRLEPLAPAHASGLLQASRDPRVWRFLPVVQPTTREDWQTWLDDALDRSRAGLELAYATVRVADRTIIGSTRYLAPRPEHRSLEIGWTWLSPDAWGSGANTEAKLLQLEHAFEQLGCRRVEFKTDAQNDRARAALAGLPAAFEGIHRQHMLVRHGENRDSAWYSILDSEWPGVRAALHRRIGRS